MATPAASPDASVLPDRMQRYAEVLKSLAAACDAMCLTAGLQFESAIPGLNDLSRSFSDLATQLVESGETSPSGVLVQVADEIRDIGEALTRERDLLVDLTSLNVVLMRRVGDLSDNVRFLTSVVSNVKIEIAAIIDNDFRLDSFADNLKTLATESSLTVKRFQATHDTMTQHLERTLVAQTAFIRAHGHDFAAAAQSISASLSAVSERRRVVAAVAFEIGNLARRIGAQIAQAVVALQIGDSTRQRLEHAADALTTAARLASGEEVDEAFGPGIEAHGARDGVAAAIGHLAAIQAARAIDEFSAEIATVTSLFDTIAAATSEVTDRSCALAIAPPDRSRSFLSVLSANLASARALINDCSKSRTSVDGSAEQVVASVQTLQTLAKEVAAMATDMTLIGTNAVVTSYRIGTAGIPLSVIAHHLRTHAIHVTDAVDSLKPALAQVMGLAERFAVSRRGQDAFAMEDLSQRIQDALQAFQESDDLVQAEHTRLEANVSDVGALLIEARDVFRDLGAVDGAWCAAREGLRDEVESEAAVELLDPAFAATLHQLLRPRYTMDAERAIHDEVLGAGHAPPAALGAGADMWL